MGRTVKVSLSASGIERALKELREYQNGLAEKQKRLTERLADIGLNVACVEFASARYDGDNDVTVSAVPTESGVNIVADGNAVAFIEFGAGVTLGNGYPGERPDGILGIGEYGQGKGKQTLWGYYGSGGTDGRYVKTTEKGDLYLTEGNPPAMAMYHAAERILEQITQIAREVFAS